MTTPNDKPPPAGDAPPTPTPATDWFDLFPPGGAPPLDVAVPIASSDKTET